MTLKSKMPRLLFSSANYLGLLLFTLICVYPFYYIFIYSISIPSEVLRGGMYLWPRGFTLVNYQELFTQSNLFHAFYISISRTVIGTVASVLCTAIFSYGITKLKKWKRLVYRMTVAALYIQAGLIPWYVTLKAYGLQNSFLLYILPGLIAPFGVVLIKTYIEQLPISLEESAMLEGAGYFMIFRKIIFPLSMPVMATIAIFGAVGQWNTWTDNFFLADTPKLQTLQYLLLNYLTSQTASVIADKSAIDGSFGFASLLKLTPESIRMTITMIATIPIMLVYPFFQKYFLTGMLLGAVKE